MLKLSVSAGVSSICLCVHHSLFIKIFKNVLWYARPFNPNSLSTSNYVVVLKMCKLINKILFIILLYDYDYISLYNYWVISLQAIHSKLQYTNSTKNVFKGNLQLKSQADQHPKALFQQIHL